MAAGGGGGGGTEGEDVGMRRSRECVVRHANFGVGAVEVVEGFGEGREGRGRGRDVGGGGLELPPVEEDLAYEQEVSGRMARARRENEPTQWDPALPGLQFAMLTLLGLAVTTPPMS